MLTELAEIGMEIARAAGRRATAGLEDETGAGDRRDPALAYARAARAVRLCIALQSRLLGELPALERAEARARCEQQQARKTEIVHLVRKVGQTGREDEIEPICDEAWERLNDADEYGEVMDLPLREAVARICEDLGLVPDWSAWGTGAFADEGPGGAADVLLPFWGRAGAKPRGGASEGKAGLEPIPPPGAPNRIAGSPPPR
ncbi:MAG TPA: hypothetical protein VL358_10340 [Caulobacteraceae bacterium]|jgi:hypothetical protein|nr:hypothetical protein [Caulobacteraceae bacterium]